ncbi:MAG: alcohol dehydrogenase [Gordonia sp.]|nr:alcohol dehydrogenase [Gordonia sp. (in: high G+C Gram-positive bacteria)]
MKTRSALLTTQPGKWEVTDVELDDPRQGEVLVKVAASGLCHSDVHVADGSQPLPNLPLAGGHEGAGVVVEVGPGTQGYEVGDHVVMSFLPVCGRCRMCATGHQNLCDLGAAMFTGSRPDDQESFRITMNGKPVGQMAGISTHSEHTVVDIRSTVKIDRTIPLDRAALLGCGVATGWGSVTNMADVHPGDVVLVMGVGGVGINSVQAAVAIGASAVIAVDPVAFKLDNAKRLGATHLATSITEGANIARELTNGQGADAAIVCVGNTDGIHLVEALDAVRKAGTVVATGVGSLIESGAPLNNTLLTLFQKRLQGALYGGLNPTWDIPNLLTQYTRGKLDLDSLITRTYTLDQIEDGYRDMMAGENIRGVIAF